MIKVVSVIGIGIILKLCSEYLKWMSKYRTRIYTIIHCMLTQIGRETYLWTIMDNFRSCQSKEMRIIVQGFWLIVISCRMYMLAPYSIRIVLFRMFILELRPIQSIEFRSTLNFEKYGFIKYYHVRLNIRWQTRLTIFNCVIRHGSIFMLYNSLAKIKTIGIMNETIGK